MLLGRCLAESWPILGTSGHNGRSYNPQISVKMVAHNRIKRGHPENLKGARKPRKRASTSMFRASFTVMRGMCCWLTSDRELLDRGALFRRQRLALASCAKRRADEAVDLFARHPHSLHRRCGGGGLAFGASTTNNRHYLAPKVKRAAGPRGGFHTFRDVQTRPAGLAHSGLSRRRSTIAGTDARAELRHRR